MKEKGEVSFEERLDTFCPVGPCLATADEIPDPSKLRSAHSSMKIKCRNQQRMI